MKIISIVGARPQFIKVAPVSRELRKKHEELIIHTGQHYDYEMSKVFFNELKIPEPDYNLGVGSGEHGAQTGQMLIKLEKVLLKEKPHLVLVYGDTNSTLAGALAAAKLHIPLAHIEAGLRSYNKKMPEEINRLLTDHISDFLFCPTETAIANLKREGFKNIINDGELTDFSSTQLPITNYQLPIAINVGDIMCDAMLMSLEIAEKRTTILKTYNLSPKNYYLATVHRAENTDNEEHLSSIVDALIEINKDKPVIWPIHPRTKKVLDSLQSLITSHQSLITIDSVSYFDMLILEKNAHKILTDSGGVQKEAYLLKVPCVTLRDETEWVETVESGWNVLAGADKEKIINAAHHLLPITHHKSPTTHYGDGRAAGKIVAVISQLEFK